MQPTIVPGVATWSRWQPDRSMFFNAWFVAGDGGNFVVDPLEPDAGDLAYVDERGLAAVVITNRDHERAAAFFAERYGVPGLRLAARRERDGRQGRTYARPTERRFSAGASSASTASRLPGEFALFDRASRSAITGDAFWGVPAGAVRLMPDEKLEDPARAALSARQLLAAGVHHLLVGDGMPVFHRAGEALVDMLDARAGVATRRVNLDELAAGKGRRSGTVHRRVRGSRTAGSERRGSAMRSACWSAAKSTARITGTRRKKRRSSSGRARRRCGRRRERSNCVRATSSRFRPASAARNRPYPTRAMRPPSY